MMSWADLEYWGTDKWKRLQEVFLKEEMIFPKLDDIFRAFKLTPLQKVKAVIIGQDPYATPDMATGLAFAVPKKVFPANYPPSLKNIFREYTDDLKYPEPMFGHLEHWANQGVLLLNRHLTVLPNKPGSMRNIGWDQLTDEVCYTVSRVRPNAVFILWGNDAQSVIPALAEGALVIKSGHPSPQAVNTGGDFLGSKPFSKTNALLKARGIPEIEWRIKP